MVEYILGNYLVETGKITKEQLKTAMKEQDSTRVKLGLIAVEEGMMTLNQAEEVNRMQAVMDKRFGDIAVTKGYLTEDQIAKLLRMQGNNFLTFIQTLMDLELVEMEDIEWLMNDFRVKNGYSFSELEAIKSDDVERIVPLLLPEEAKGFTEVISIAVRTLIRLVDRHIYIGKAVMADSLPGENQVSQALEGENGIIVSFSERDGALLKVSSVFGQEEFAKIDLDSLDAAGELLNCINGLYVSSLSRQGKFLELMPPEYDNRVAKEKAPICRVPIFVGDCGLYFTVAELA